jgi:hypothetical protein
MRILMPRRKGCTQPIRPSNEVRCRHCGNRVSQLSDEDAKSLRDRFAESPPSTPAFECHHCEVIIYEDEFISGEFVPPKSKFQITQPILLMSSNLGAICLQAGLALLR